MSPDEMGYSATVQAPPVPLEDSRENKDWVDRVGRRSSVHRPAEYSTNHAANGVKRRRLSDEQGE